MTASRQAMAMLPRWARDHINDLRRERKAAFRECGRLSDRLHTTRLEITVLRSQLKATKDALKESLLTNSYLQQRIDELEKDRDTARYTPEEA